MTGTSLPVFEHTVQITNEWLRELAEDLSWYDDRHRAYHALRVVLHTLRDRLAVENAAALGAQLPMLVRGLFFEGWQPAGKPLKERTKVAFLTHVAAAYPTEPTVDAEGITRSVFKLLEGHVSQGEIDKIRSVLPADIRALWDNGRASP